ncbi:hypothetical protein GCM10011369_11990 [Neiella marina]|uniref:Radical SAM core domain-containing protein n=2 Tax=Neiella marina TaxID=508461 RepID=A0A8J2U3X8_9GAMM|nr:hypothetical protein GCM10011369_11990 [Neiella marina]
MHCNGIDKQVGYDIDGLELLKLLYRDKSLYQKSDGGVTFSGGEPMLQTDYIRSLLPYLKRENIHVAIDTAGNVPSSAYQSLSDEVDLFLFDLKIIDPVKHRQHTGVSNKQILKNFTQLVARQQPIELRLPVIKGINDSEADIKQLASFLLSLPQRASITELKVLPYHAMGRSKYQQLGMTTAIFEAPDTSILAQYQQTIGQVLDIDPTLASSQSNTCTGGPDGVR